MTWIPFSDRFDRLQVQEPLIANGDRAGIRPECPGDDLDERRFAAAIFAHEAANLARSQGQRHVAQRLHTSERLADVTGGNRLCWHILPLGTPLS